MARFLHGPALVFLCVVATTPLAAQQPSVVPLDTVLVEAASRVAPTIVSGQRSVEVITREAIARRPARSVTDLLATTLGADVQTRSPAQADLSLRGSSLGQVLVLVDGVRVNDLQTAHFDLDLAMPLDAVERIEVLRGPAVALYGSDAVGGVVNIVTRRAEAWRQARVHHGSFGTTGGAVGAGGITVRGLALRAAADAERSAGHRDGTDYDVVQGSAGIERMAGRARIALDGGFASRNFGAADFYAPAPSYERTRTQTASLRAGRTAGEWQLSAALAGRRHTDDFILRRADPSFYRNRHTTLQRTVEVGGRRQLGDAAGIALGAEGFDAELASARLGNRREQRAAAFGELTLGEARSANLSLGLRVDRSAALGTFGTPSVAASVPVHERMRLRASAGRGLRAPSWTERYYRDPGNVADPGIEPERFWAGELGARALPRWGSVDVAAFVRRADDVIDWVKPVGSDASVPWVTANLERATYRGLELSATVADLAGAEVSLGATHLRFESESAAGYVGKYALRPLTRVLFASVTRELAGGLRIAADVREARRAGESRYLLANARLSLRLPAVTLTLDGTNLTAARYLDASAQPAAGRALTLGLQL